MPTIICGIGPLHGTRFYELCFSVYDGPGSERFDGLPGIVGHVVIGLESCLIGLCAAVRDLLADTLTEEELNQVLKSTEEQWQERFGLSELNLNQR